ncbi:MAG: hypothetical protein U0Q11_17600 [Vicinamibacterales bacterium]
MSSTMNFTPDPNGCSPAPAGADQRDVAVNRLVLHDTVTLANALAHLGTQLLLFGLGDLDVLELLRALQRTTEISELTGSHRLAGDGQDRRRNGRDL